MPVAYAQSVQDDSKKVFSHAEELFLREDYESSAKECEALDAPMTEDALRREAIYLCGLSYLKLDKPISAREKFERLLFDPKSSVFHDKAALGLGDTYFLSGNYQRAKNEYQRLVSSHKDSPLMPSAYFKLAESEKAEGHWNKAKEYYELVMKDYPESFEAKRAGEFLSKGEYFFTVQVGAFARQDNAIKFKDGLIRKGYDAYALEPTKGDIAVYRVRIGKFKDRNEAVALKSKLEEEGLLCKIIP